MTRRFLTVHRWIGICLGVLLFIWLASGIVMILPFKRLAPAPSTSDVDISTVLLSPAEAAAVARAREGDSLGVKSFSLVVVGDDALYRLVMAEGNSFLISSRSGERLVVDSARAEALARAGLGGSAPITSTVQLRERSFQYPVGNLPVWRVEFGDARRTVAWVGVRDAAVVHDARLGRVRTFVARLHTFDQVRWLTGSRLAQNGSLGVTSGNALLLVLTGYYLALPRRWRRRWERSRGAVE